VALHFECNSRVGAQRAAPLRNIVVCVFWVEMRNRQITKSRLLKPNLTKNGVQFPMLKGLHLKNFKSWREADVLLAPITGFFGANSSGKSSLLQALLLMKQSVESSDPNLILEFGGEKTLVDLGGFNDVIFQKDTQSILVLGLSFTSNSDKYLLKSHIGVQASQVGLLKTEFWLNEFFAEMSPQEALQTQTKFYHPPLDLFVDDDDIGDQVENNFADQIHKIEYLMPLRAYPKRVYLWSGAAPSNVGKSGENTTASLVAARVSNTQIDGKPLEVVISEKLEQLKLIHSFRLEELREGTNIFRVLLRRTPESPEVSLTDVGFGVSQLLPVLVLLYYVPEGSTVILEQPELHLHPSVQAGLADIFIDAWQTRGIQILLESHSEHLLQRLQRRVAEEKIPNTDVALYFCSLEQGESKLTTLELDEYGAIRNYPKDFFGDQFGEIAATSTAALERKIASQKEKVPA
jgi:predicted ATPase